MVGDDIVNDVRGAQVLGLRGVLVRTGKFLPGDLAKVTDPPDHVLEIDRRPPGPAGRVLASPGGASRNRVSR